MKILITLLILSIYSFVAISAETCSRLATVNFQEVLVDSSTSKKGEGLRFYLDKDPIAKSILNKYQDRNKASFTSAALSTIGSSMISAGLLGVNTGREEAIFQRDNLVIGGLMVIALNYLTTVTIQYNNEALLERSVEQYNKRNTPTIYFSPYKNADSDTGVGIGIKQDF